MFGCRSWGIVVLESERVIRFIEEFCTLGHSFMGRPFVLMDFQKDIIRDIYLESADGERLRRSYLLGLPRKNGKSQLGAALALYALIADSRDASPVVVSAAADRAQAKLVFDEACRMVRMSPALSEACTVLRNEIRCHRNGGSYRAVSADAGSQQGLNPSAVIFDEYHVQKNDDLMDALRLGSAARRAPLMVVISTAGYDLGSPLGRMYMAGLRLDGHLINGVAQAGEDVDRSFGMSWFGPTLEDMRAKGWSHREPAEWRRVNPGWDIFPNAEADFGATLKASHESAFVRFKLNGWTTSGAAFLPAGAWAALEDKTKKLEKNEKIVLGFDGAWKGDSTGLVAIRLSDGFCSVLGHWEAPENDPDWRTPADEVEARVLWACDEFDVREMVADPWRFEQSLLRLQEEHGVPVVEFPTGSRSRMIPATGSFYASVMEGSISHDGDPALARHLAAAVLKETPMGGLITKEYKSSKRHIDLAVALVVGLSRAAHWRDEAPESNDSLVLVL